MRRPAPSDRGAATLLAVAMAGLLLMVGAGAGAVGALVVDHRRAQAAADLAALAGATAAQRGEDPCAAVAVAALANAARALDCTADDEAVLVTVEVVGPRWWGRSPRLRASARAGPG